MNSSRWRFRPARSGFISKTIDEEVGIFPDIAFSLCAVPSRRDNVLEALSLLFLSLCRLRIRAAVAFQIVVIFFIVTHLVRCTSANDLGSDLSILINNDLLCTSRSDCS
jgi:hypothetical protein